MKHCVMCITFTFITLHLKCTVPCDVWCEAQHLKQTLFSFKNALRSSMGFSLNAHLHQGCGFICIRHILSQSLDFFWGPLGSDLGVISVIWTETSCCLFDFQAASTFLGIMSEWEAKLKVRSFLTSLLTDEFHKACKGKEWNFIFLLVQCSSRCPFLLQVEGEFLYNRVNASRCVEKRKAWQVSFGFGWLKFQQKITQLC